MARLRHTRKNNHISTKNIGINNGSYWSNERNRGDYLKILWFLNERLYRDNKDSYKSEKY